MGDRKPMGIASFGVSFGDASDGDDETSKSGFRILVLSELVARSDWSTGRAPPSDPIAIDVESFDGVMGRLAPSLAIDVADPFDGSEMPLRVDLVWRDRKAMRPGSIVEQGPALRALAE